MNKNALAQDYLQTQFTHKRSKGFFPACVSPSYQEQSALKTACDNDYLENGLIGEISKPRFPEYEEMSTALVELSVFPIRRLSGSHRYSSQTREILSHLSYSFPSSCPRLKIGGDSLNCTHWRYFPQQREVHEVFLGVDDLLRIFLILPSNFRPK